MSVLILAVTKTTAPGGPSVVEDKTVVVESDKFTILPIDSDTRSLVIVNGYQFEVDAEVAELASAMNAVDASAYT